jgi:hypothetical protein
MRQPQLVRIPVAERHDLIWVRVSQGLTSTWTSRWAAWDRRTGSWWSTRFLETWHVATLHRATVGPIFQPNVTVFDAFGRIGRLIIPRRSMRRLKCEPESGWDFLKHSATVYTLFPNALLVWQQDLFETWRDRQRDRQMRRGGGAVHARAGAER